MRFQALKLLLFLLYGIGGILELSAFTNPVKVDVERGICAIHGKEYPAVGFGTYPLTGTICAQAIAQAVASGYRIIDTATFYENFDSIAQALHGYDRRDFYLISKVWHDRQSPENLRRDLNLTLKQLKTDYLDAYLIHWPNSKISIQDTLEAMNALKKAGFIRHIGLSNVNVNHLKRALESNVAIAWVQVEMHPLFYDPELIKLCKENSIGIQAWAPLGRGRVSEDPLLKRLGKKYSKSASQIALRWIIQHQCIPLPGSKNLEHMKQNIDIADFVLSNEDMEEINYRAAQGQRERVTEETGIGFTDEFDFSYEECWPN